jgi:hypothetical protein
MLHGGSLNSSPAWQVGKIVGVRYIESAIAIQIFEMKSQPRYSKEEFARRGDELYERVLRGSLESGNEGRFVAIDIETGNYEIDADELTASDRLLARVPNAQIWLRRIGSRYAHRFGLSRSPTR